MKDVPAPQDLGLSDGSFVAAVASILDIDDPHEVPHESWTLAGNWLGTRGLGFVPVKEPQTFSTPGPWLAVLRDGTCAVAFGSPPGIAWDPLRRTGGAAFEDVEAGFVIAPTDVALWQRRDAAGAPGTGVVESLLVAGEKEAPMRVLREARMVADRGIEGDRYHAKAGTFTKEGSRGNDLTLIAAEALAELGLTPEDGRRNVVTRGVDLDALVGRRFRVGEVECLGQRLCEPCAHLERLTRPGVLRAMVHRGGLRADVLSDGVVRVGDTVSPV